MTKNIKTLIVAGGTGGHVFPGINLASFLIEKNYKVKIVTDKRGYKFFKDNDKKMFQLFYLSPLIKKIFFFTIFFIVNFHFNIEIIDIFLFYRPNIIFGMGGYASFPICIAAAILRIKFIIYENNLIIGRANKKLLPYAERIFVSNKNLEGISSKYNFKITEIGNIINKRIINFSFGSKTKKKNLIFLF